MGSERLANALIAITGVGVALGIAFPGATSGFSLSLAALSLAGLVTHAEVVVNRLERVAKAAGVSEVIIATSLVSVGTSLPEISLHVLGSLDILANPGNQVVLQDVSSTVLANNIGSDVVQQTLIMGSVIVLAAFIGGKNRFVFQRGFIKTDYFPMIGAHVLVLLLALNGFISRIEGALLLSAFAAYMYYLYRHRSERLLRHGDSEPSNSLGLDLAVGLVSMGIVLGSGEIFLRLVTDVASGLGVPASFLGVLAGVVSAFPELVTAVMGMREGAEGISLGTLIGSNITNPLMGIGIGAAISGYAVPGPLVRWDLPVQILTAGLLVAYLWNRESVGNVLDRDWSRGELTWVGGLALMALYIFYIVVRWQYFGVDF